MIISTSFNDFPIVTIDGDVFKIKNLLADGDSNTKLRKSSGAGFLTAGLSLSPHKSAGVGNMCSSASAGCIKACLNHQGLASVFTRIQLARIAKTIAWGTYRDWFLGRLAIEIANHARTAERVGMRLAVRLNVFSDLPWEKFGIVDLFPNVQFYDYTKNPKRVGLLRSNYWVTLSRSEVNTDACVEALNRCHNVAMVFADSQKPYVGNRSHLQQMPKRYLGFDVIDGDTTDLRFDDVRGRKSGKIIGLRLKTHSHAERAAAVESGFPIMV